MMRARPSLDEMFMSFAIAAASRSACSRDRPGVGAVITDRHGFVTFGYNGPVRGGQNSCSARVGECGCFHAEANALIKPRPLGVAYTMYVTLSPCASCAGLIINARDVREVVYLEPYRDDAGLRLLRASGLVVRRSGVSFDGGERDGPERRERGGSVADGDGAGPVDR